MYSMRTKRLLQTLFTAVCVTCATNIIYHVFSNSRERNLNVVEWRDKAAVRAQSDYGEYLQQSFEDYFYNEWRPTSENIFEIAKAAGPFPISLSDMFIGVKTTKRYHHLRLPTILKTWFQLAKEQIWFFTDSDDHLFQRKTSGHMINTNCSSSHSRTALCCKMSVEFDTFLDSNKKWFCHFDDDNYVNIPQLIRLLSEFNYKEDWYLGKPSIPAPLEILNRDNADQKISFWFATGGAGFCVSQALALKMMPLASGGKFIAVGEKIRFPDDVTMGFIIGYLLKKPLTIIDQFHSHLEPMQFLNNETFREQVSFSFCKNNTKWNVINIAGFNLLYDPKRFFSLHCFLFPRVKFCPR